MANILLVDDAKLVRKRMSKILEKNDYNVVGEADNGQCGVDRYQELNPDLVILDITMPILSGVDALKKSCR